MTTGSLSWNRVRRCRSAEIWTAMSPFRQGRKVPPVVTLCYTAGGAADADMALLFFLKNRLGSYPSDTDKAKNRQQVANVFLFLQQWFCVLPKFEQAAKPIRNLYVVFFLFYSFTGGKIYLHAYVNVPHPKKQSSLARAIMVI